MSQESNHFKFIEYGAIAVAILGVWCFFLGQRFAVDVYTGIGVPRGFMPGSSAENYRILGGQVACFTCVFVLVFLYGLTRYVFALLGKSLSKRSHIVLLFTSAIAFFATSLFLCDKLAAGSADGDFKHYEVSSLIVSGSKYGIDPGTIYVGVRDERSVFVDRTHAFAIKSSDIDRIEIQRKP
jgi:hypothetical protein